MSTRYREGEAVVVTSMDTVAVVDSIEEPQSSSPTYGLEDGRGRLHTVKASQIRKLKEGDKLHHSDGTVDKIVTENPDSLRLQREINGVNAALHEVGDRYWIDKEDLKETPTQISTR